MIELHLTRGDNQEGVRLRFPTTPAEIGEAFALLDTVSRYAGDVRILTLRDGTSSSAVKSPSLLRNQSKASSEGVTR